MDHTYNDFDDIKYDEIAEVEDKENEHDELMAKLLSASDYLCSDDLDNANEVLLDIQELTSTKE